MSAPLPTIAEPKRPENRLRDVAVLALVLAGWFALWSLTPGLLAHGVGTWISDDYAVVILTESLIAVGLAVPLLLLHRRFTRVLFAPSRLLWVYSLPLVAAVALPFHYGLILPVALYMFWMTVSVFWQDYLTFGLLQSYLRERLPSWLTIVLVALTFYLGHALFLPDKFAPTHVVPSLAILALGVVLALLRTRPRSLHLVLALHLTFYFVFA